MLYLLDSSINISTCTYSFWPSYTNIVVSGNFSHIKLSLKAIAQSDIETRCRYRWEQKQERFRLRNLQNPVQTWKNIVSSCKSDTRMFISRCQVQRNANEEVNVEDEEAINKARIEWEKKSNQVTYAVRSAEWDKRTWVHIKIHSLMIIIWLTCYRGIEYRCGVESFGTSRGSKQRTRAMIVLVERHCRTCVYECSLSTCWKEYICTFEQRPPVLLSLA